MSPATAAQETYSLGETLVERCLRGIRDGLANALNVEPRDPFPPHPGRQEEFFHHKATVIFFGGQAGGGKSIGLIGRAARYVHVAGYDAVIFRRTITDALKPGAIWSQMKTFYPALGGVPNEGTHTWRFPSGAQIALGHLEGANSHINWQGAQLKFIGFDEGTHFTEEQFWYLSSRLRGSVPVPGTIALTCNPDPDSFVAKLIEWYIDQETGYAIAKRSGVTRWYTRRDGKLHWSESKAQLLKQFEGARVKSFTFIQSKLEDNPSLDEGDPEYRGNLEALPLIERERLLKGNWKIRPSAGKCFNRDWFKCIVRVPEDVQIVARVRYWDNASSTEAGSKGRGDRTAGVLMGVGSDGNYYIFHSFVMMQEAAEREKLRKQVAQMDGADVFVVIEQDPGSAGKDVAQAIVRNMAGSVIEPQRVTGPKVVRWGPLASQAEAGNVFIVAEENAPWVRDFVEELHHADGSDKVHDDQADAAAGAFIRLAEMFGQIGFM